MGVFISDNANVNDGIYDYGWCSNVFGHAITIIRLPVGITEFVAGIGLAPLSFIIAVMFLIFVLECF